MPEPAVLDRPRRCLPAADIGQGAELDEAQNINVVALYPWLMIPVIPVIVLILAFNFFGDGLRDAADPYR